MHFSNITLKILEQYNKFRAAGDPDADLKLAHLIEAAIAGRPRPLCPDSPAHVRSDGKVRSVELTVEEERALLFGDLENR
jgi:hypothetical protein